MASGDDQSFSIASPRLSVCSSLLEIELLEEVAGGDVSGPDRLPVFDAT
jgi:hypothetical protein